jgi:hypothetical protein
MSFTVSVGGFVVLGLLVGYVWSLVADPAVYTVTGGTALMGEQAAVAQFGVTVDYVWLAAIAAMGWGAAVGWWSDRIGWTYLVFLIFGASVAALVSWRFGLALGPAEPMSVIAGAANSDEIPLRITIDSYGALLVWPVAALFGSIAATLLLARARPD